MCDLLAACFSTEYRAPKTLHRFMIRSIERGDIDGWGLGFFLKNREAVVVKDIDLIIKEELILSAFDLVVRCIESEIILAHLRLASRKDLYGREYAHPFKDEFLDSQWVFAHNGYSRDILSYKTPGNKIHTDPEFDSPKVFEFIRDKMIEYLRGRPTRSLFNAVRYAVKELYNRYGGTFNFVLANSNILFVNLDGRHKYNNKMYMSFREKKGFEKAIIVTTIPRLTDEDWIVIRARNPYRGKLLMFSEGELLYNADI
mgnify:FL=1